mmetsp:Transcript_58030/g.138125  ORF Transcript_58030/g.138125 Transcript_58030/m.138125 type:complete len:246 (-) Transcript_58030:34-771(-)
MVRALSWTPEVPWLNFHPRLNSQSSLLARELTSFQGQVEAAPEPGGAAASESSPEHELNYKVQETESPEQLDGALQDDMEHQGPRVFKEYKLFVDTAGPSTGSRGDVFIQMMGDYGKTGLIRLKRVWAPGSRTEFSVFAPEIGKVEAVRLVADTENPWRCDRVWLEDVNGVREFPVGRAIGWPDTPEVLVAPALNDDIGPFSLLLALALQAAKRDASKGICATRACRSRSQLAQGCPRSHLQAFL